MPSMSKSWTTTEVATAMAKKLDPIPPGEILQVEFLEPLGISQAQLARDLDLPVNRIAGIIKSERAINADTALRLAARFETSADMWLRLQADYDLRLARQGNWPAIERKIKKRAAA
jgi:antitoxin HigA-1